eukprot:6481076-Amphidinium_carterae.2
MDRKPPMEKPQAKRHPGALLVPMRTRRKTHAPPFRSMLTSHIWKQVDKLITSQPPTYSVALLPPKKRESKCGRELRKAMKATIDTINLINDELTGCNKCKKVAPRPEPLGFFLTSAATAGGHVQDHRDLHRVVMLEENK